MLSRSISKVIHNSKLLASPSALSFRPAFRFAVSPQQQKRFQLIRRHTTLSEYPGLNSEVRRHTKTEVRVIEDQQTGLRFLVESGGFTGCADMGICIKLGTQDETQSNAGSLQYLKSFVHMKPTFEELVGNYQILSQTGSTFDLNYDTISTYAKCSFLEEDQDLMADLLLDLAIQEKNMFEDNHVSQFGEDQILDLVKKAAFGNFGLGMSKKGIGNVLTNKEFLKFQEKITPRNMIISLSNISNPEELIAKIKQKIQTKYPKFLKRQLQPTPKSQYIGGLKAFQTENEFFQFAVAFPGATSKSENMELFNILRVLLGNASSFSSGGPGKGMHSRCTRNLLNQVRSVEKASFINEHYEDIGLFGLSIGGPSKDWEELVVSCLSETAKLLAPIEKEELDRAKHILISSLYLNTERASDRLEELTKHIFYYGKVKMEEFEANIRKVTAEDIQRVMKATLSQKPTFVYGVNDPQMKLPNEKVLITEFERMKRDALSGKLK